MEGRLNLTDCSCPPVYQVEDWAKYILEEVSIPAVGTVGLLGNLAAIIVLSRVVFLYKANYKSSPIQVLFFLVVPCNILRPLAAF